MKQITKNLMFSVFGISCKLGFHAIALIISFIHAPKIGFLLLAIWIIHNAITLWFMRGKELKLELVKK